MSANKSRFNSTLARAVADELVEALTPRCERIEIAGSLRRGKPDADDIDILYVPRIGQIRVPGELFPKKGSLSDELIDQWLVKGVLTKRPNKNGVTAWGALNKLGLHTASGIGVDLFATTTERWFCSLVIRTGSEAMCKRLTSAALNRSMQLHAYNGTITGTAGEQIIPQSEREVFELCGVPYREPAAR